MFKVFRFVGLTQEHKNLRNAKTTKYTASLIENWKLKSLMFNIIYIPNEALESLMFKGLMFKVETTKDTKSH